MQLTRKKVQAAFPVCWAFASASAIESSILKHQKRTAGTLPAPQEHATPQLYDLPSKPDLSEHAFAWYAFARQSEASAPGQAGEGLYIEPPNGRESANGRQFHHAARADVRVAELDDRGKDPLHIPAPP